MTVLQKKTLYINSLQVVQFAIMFTLTNVTDTHKRNSNYQIYGLLRNAKRRKTPVSLLHLCIFV